jgi:signal transduction histidine kinase
VFHQHGLMPNPVSVTPVTGQVAHERFYQILNAVPAMIAVLSGPSHVIEFANTRFMSAVSLRPLVGREIREVLPTSRPELLDLIDEVYATGERRTAQAIEAPLADETDAHSTRYFDVIYEALRDDSGAVHGVIIHAVDVTEQVAAHAADRARADQLARIAAALRRSNRELDAFAYAASHDLRAPLRGIANLAQWIEEDLQDKLTDDSRDMLALMRSRMHRMEALIDGILQYSRAGRAHEPIREVNVAELVADVVDLLSPQTATIIVNPDLPVLRAERLPLQQVFQNLISNAAKHGGEGVTVEISSQDAGDFWEFRVTDDGPGIAPEFQDRIWGIFQTLQPRDQVEGAGIGLSLVKKLVEAQGGRVAVASAEGSGAVFSVWWPKVAEERTS